MHVTRLKANLNSPNGQPYEFDLGLHTLVVGDNEAGKSSCVSTPLRLALTGTTDDVAGRDDVKDSQLLAQHAPTDGACTLAALATFDDGSEASWGAVIESDGTVKRPMHDAPNAIDASTVLPLRSVREVLRGDAKTARRTFLQWVGQTTTAEDVMAAIPAHLHAKYTDIAEKQQGSSTDRLIAVAEYASGRVRSIEADAKGQDALLEGMVQGVQAAPSKEEVERERQAVEQWTNALSRAAAWEGRVQVDVSMLQQERLALQQGVEEAREAVAAWENQVQQHGQPPAAPAVAQADDRVSSLASLLEEASASGVCPVYLNPVGSDHLSGWAAYHRGRSKPDTSALDAHAQAVVEWRARRQPAADAVAGWQSVLTQRARALAELDGRLAGLTSVAQSATVENPGVTVQQAREGLDAARARLATLERTLSSWETVRQARDRAAALRAEKPAYEDLRNQCNNAVKELLAQQRASFQERVQKYLPDRWKFEIQLQDGGKEVFRVGFRRDDGRLHTLLSGAALDALEVALCMAVWELGGGAAKGKGKKGAATGGKYALVIPRDRQRTPEVLTELMRAWASFPGQVIVETTILPKGRTPAGWQVLDLNAWRKGLELPVVEKAETPLVPWCYDPTADTYLRASEADRAKQNALSLAHLVEIEGLDEAAPARHRAAMVARRGLSHGAHLVPGNGGMATAQAGSGGGNLSPPPAVSQDTILGAFTPGPISPPPPFEEEVYDRPALPPAAVEPMLRTLGYLPEKIEKMGPKLRMLVATEGVPPECTMTLGNSFVIYGVDNKPARSLPLGE